jgi:hypothetical protein
MELAGPKWNWNRNRLGEDYVRNSYLLLLISMDLFVAIGYSSGFNCVDSIVQAKVILRPQGIELRETALAHLRAQSDDLGVLNEWGTKRVSGTQVPGEFIWGWQVSSSEW